MPVIWAAATGRPWMFWAACLLVPFSLWHYSSRRWKASQAAYQYLAMLADRPVEGAKAPEAKPPGQIPPGSNPASGNPG